MNRLLSLFVVCALSITLPIDVAAAAQQTGQIGGWGSADGIPLRNATVRLRNIESGELVAMTTSDESGIFAFVTVPAGTYVVELACGSGGLLGASAPVALATGALTASGVAIEVNAAAARAAGAGACLSSKSGDLFELARRPFKNLLGVTVAAAAAVSGVAAVVATKNDTSASR
jgi:hypothetical protein